MFRPHPQAPTPPHAARGLGGEAGLPEPWPWHVHRDDELPPAGEAWIFVFGANLAGNHSVGAARIARERFGAEAGVALGPTGQALAIPIKDQALRVLALPLIAEHVRAFVAYAGERREQRFWLTRVGCGPAGYSNRQMAEMFADMGSNCSMPLEWAVVLRPHRPTRP